MSIIKSYHAHVYFDASSRPRARQLTEEASQAFGLSVGRLHDKPVGPHPRGSCLVAFNADRFAQVIPWLIVNRRGLTVFAHAITGDTVKDHTDHVLWLGLPNLSPYRLFQHDSDLSQHWSQPGPRTSSAQARPVAQR
jgi:aromatic ring-cleaving dioxygenase